MAGPAGPTVGGSSPASFASRGLVVLQDSGGILSGACCDRLTTVVLPAMTALW